MKKLTYKKRKYKALKYLVSVAFHCYGLITYSSNIDNANFEKNNGENSSNETIEKESNPLKNENQYDFKKIDTTPEESKLIISDQEDNDSEKIQVKVKEKPKTLGSNKTWLYKAVKQSLSFIFFLLTNKSYVLVISFFTILFYSLMFDSSCPKQEMSCDELKLYCSSLQ